MKGIIFDFNGTMFMDSDLHEAAWLYVIQKYTEKKMTEEDILKHIHGKTNDVILRHFISSELTDEQVEQLSDEKEAYYRKLVLASPNHQGFTKGAEGSSRLLKRKKDSNDDCFSITQSEYRFLL